MKIIPYNHKHFNLWKIILPIFLLVLIVTAYAVMSKNQPKKVNITTNTNLNQNPINTSTDTDQTISKSENKIFLVTRGQKITAYIFDITTKKIIAQKNISSVDPTALSSTNAIGANDAFQYNPRTGKIFFLTSGIPEMSSDCQNKDQTCFNRIYQTDFETGQPKLIFQADGWIKNWIVNPQDDSIWVSWWSYDVKTGNFGDKNIIENIDVNSKKVVFSKFRETTLNFSDIYEFILSQNQNFIYQAIIKNINNNSELTTISINNKTGDMIEEKILGGDMKQSPAISPNGLFTAFYATAPQNENFELYLYDNKNRNLKNLRLMDQISNYNLFWSEDSSKLLYQLKSGLVSYEIQTGQKNALVNLNKNIVYVYGWIQPLGYIAFEADKQIWLGSIATSNKFTVPININELESAGFKFY